MKSIEIDDDIYSHLLKNASQIGESASSILRRLLKFSNSRASSEQLPMSPADECINDPRFQMGREVVDRYLVALGWLHRRHRQDFRKVTQIKGRSREYFSESIDGLEKTGNSVQPRQIPDSSYWALTNNDTPKKQRILYDAMLLFGYSNGEADKLSRALE